MDDLRAIERVLNRYCHLCDDGRFEELVELFTPDAVFAFGRREVIGTAALLEYYERSQAQEKRGKHIASN